MHAQIDGICRGDGKIFMRVIANGVGKTHSLSLDITTKDNQHAPCSIYEVIEPGNDAGRRLFVGTLPILALHGKEAVISEIDECGNVVDSSQLPFSFTRAKWESRFNYKANADLCAKIRNYDRIALYDQVSIQFWECIPDGEMHIVRGVIRLPFHPESQIVFSCTNDVLDPLPINPVFLSDAEITADFSDDVRLREVQFSVRIPSNSGNLIFTASDSRHRRIENFEVLEVSRRKELLHDFEAMTCNAQVDQSYMDWFEAQKVELSALSKQARIQFPVNPTFSIIVPLYKTPLPYFDEMVESVLMQSYKKWELILVNASPDDFELSNRTQDAANGDERIKVITLENNLGISENTNKGIDEATGDFICFFDHDDVLEPNLLFEYARAINENETTDVLYCDEDKLLQDGSLCQPFFKPDFNIDLLRNNNYICHMLAIRTTLLRTLAPNTAEFDGAQDHNLTLEASEKARLIHHVPRVLYHWRLSESSTAANADSKPYATIAGIKAVQNHLDRLGLEAAVSQSRRPFTYNVRYAIPSDRPLVSIIIPTKDHIDVLDTCISSILKKSTYENFEIIIIENNSTLKETFDYYDTLLDRDTRIRIEKWGHEFNFSKLMNFGTQKASGKYLIYLNNDTEVITPEWIEIMLGICQREDVGIVGCRLFYPDETIQHAGLCVTGGVAGHLGKNLPRGQWGYFALHDATQDLSAVTAACMMTKKGVVESVGGWDEELAVAFNDVDFCLKVRDASLLVVYTPEVELYHHESLSRGTENNILKQIRFHREVSYMNYKWARYYVSGDPYINPNISQMEPNNCYYHLP